MRLNVGSMASRMVVTAPSAMRVAAAARLMREQHVGTLVVVSDSVTPVKPTGLLTDRDLVMEILAQGVNPELVTVGDIATRPVVTAREDDALFDAIQSMNRNAIRRLVVIDNDGVLTGLLSMDDVIGVLAEELTGLSKTIDRETRSERTQRPALAGVE